MILSQTIAEAFFISPSSRDREIFMSKIMTAKDRREDTLEKNTSADWGSDDDELYYDAVTENEKNNHWLNNQVCGSFSRWKTRSCLPLGEFMKRLKKNLEPTTRLIQVDKDIYEKQIQEMKEAAKLKILLKSKFKSQMLISSK